METKRRQLAAIVGEDNVLDDPKILEEFSHDESLCEPLRPWFVVRPATESEVQALVKWANSTATPLVPVSSGAPHFYGDTVPTATEAVVVDLSRMKAIKRIDRRNRIAVIEPGVTYSELAPALAKEGLRIPRPLAPRANKSVVASLLERQPTTIPRLNFSLPEPLRNCGVVWGSGELAFTGEAGNGPLNLEAQWQRGLAQVDGKGPLATDLMRLVTGAQGSMGIVVWASIKLELIPAVRSSFFVPHSELSGLVDFIYKLTKVRLGDETLLLNRAKLAALVEPQPAAARKLREALPEWVALVGLAGTALFPEERLKVQEKEFRALVQEFRLTLCGGFAGVSRADVVRLIDGDCSDHPPTLAAKGASQDIFFLTTLDKAAGLHRDRALGRRALRLSVAGRRHLHPAATPGRRASRRVQFSLRPERRERGRQGQRHLPGGERRTRSTKAPISLGRTATGRNWSTSETPARPRFCGPSSRSSIPPTS